MILFIYKTFWTMAMVGVAPVVLVLRNRRFRQRTFPALPSERPAAGSIWIHALSVGEVLSAVPLVEAVLKQFPDRTVVFTATTPKGMKVARDLLEDRVGALLRMPVDFWWSVRRLVRWIRPSLFLLVETDLWPGLLDGLGREGAARILINGRVSPRTLRGYRRFPVFVRTVFGLLDECLMQSEVDRERLIQVGVDPRKVVVTGNIKFDRRWEPMGEEEKTHWLNTLHLDGRQTIWIAGSTHPGEEEIVLRALHRLRIEFPHLGLIIAPRQIERANAILREASRLGFKALLRSRLARDSSYDVLVLDTLGELGRIYGLGRIAFVGGSLVPFGGHNILEPANFGRPVLFGPHMHNFQTMSESFLEAGGGWCVSDGEALIAKVRMLLKDRELLEGMGSRARQFVQRNQGALDRVLGRIEWSLKKRGSEGASTG